MEFLRWLREKLDGIILSDHEWKKKYCPTLYNYLFCLNEEERHKQYLEMQKGAEERFQEGVRMGVCGTVYLGNEEEHNL